MKGIINKQPGFTVVELLIVIVVIGVLAAITIVTYSNIQNNAKNVHIQSDLTNVRDQIEIYAATHQGAYPSTGGLSVVRTDANCGRGTKQVDWVPNLSEPLPQSGKDMGATGASSERGCFMYSSDGTNYVLTAWNGVNGGPQTSTFYRRLGYREMGYADSNSYICNHVNIGGNSGNVYKIKQDYYKYSYTISSIETCNETPPPGA